MADPRTLQILDAAVARLKALYVAGTVTTTVGAGIGANVQVADSSGLKRDHRVKFAGANERTVVDIPDSTHVTCDSSVAWSDGQAVTQSRVAGVVDFERPTRDIPTFPEWQVVYVEEAKPPPDNRLVPIGEIQGTALFVVKSFAKTTDAEAGDREAVILGGLVEQELAKKATPAPTWLGLGFVRRVQLVRNELRYAGKELQRNNAVLVSAVEVVYRHDDGNPF